MKKRITAIIMMAFLFVLLFSEAAASEVKAAVTLDGSTLNTDALIDGETVGLPVRDVCEALGYSVMWSDINGVRKVTVRKDADTVVFDLTHQQVTDNGHPFSAVIKTGGGIWLVSSRTYIDSGLFSTVFPVAADYNAQRELVTLETRVENNLSVKTEKLSSEMGYLTAAIQYPQLDGLADSAVQSVVNALLKQAAQDALATGEKNASDMASSIRDGYTGAVGKCETLFDYTLTYNQNGLFSVVMMDYQYAGGAHGSTVQSSYTVDLTSGNALALEDLMDESAEPAPYINASIRQEIDRRVEAGDLYEFEFAPFSGFGENPEYYLSNSAVVFYFQEYEYFPYASGIQEFTVPFDELSGMFAAPYSYLGGPA